MTKKKSSSETGPTAASDKMAELKISDTLKFPLRPKRDPNEKPPGKVVRLVSNLLMMSYNQNKPIYRYGVDVSFQQQSTKDGDTSMKAKERKIPNFLRRQVVKAAVEQWVSVNQPREYNNTQNSYAFDLNASTIYTLFNMFVKIESQSVSQSIVITVPTDYIEQKKVVYKDTEFCVKIHKGTLLNVNKLFEACKPNTKKTQSFDIIEHTELIRVINVLVHSTIYSLPTHITTKHSVFPFLPENQFSIGAVGRGFNQDRNCPPPKTGVIYNKGYSLSVRPTECGIVLNVANTGRTFLESMPLTAFLGCRFNVNDFGRPLQDFVITNLKKELMTKQVEAIHHNYGTKERPHYRKYRVSGITSKPCSQEKFQLVDHASKKANEITIVEYFKKEYKYTLKYPNLPCIESNGRKIPLEVCKLVEKQGINRKNTPEETSDVIRKMAVRPEEHFKMIEKSIQEVKKYSQPLKEFGLDFDVKMIEVDGRELSPFSLEAGRGALINPRDGAYETTNKEFYKPVIVEKWAVVFLVDRMVERDMNRNGLNALNGMKFAEAFNREAKSRGIIIKNPPQIDGISLNGQQQDLKRRLRENFVKWNTDKLDHVFIIIPDKCDDWIYSYIQYLEVSTGSSRKENESFTRTSRIKYNNYTNKIINDRFGGKMFLANLALKYNTKLGGINFIISQKNKSFNKFLGEGYIFFSVDVCHPAPGDKLIQSVAAVVGMWNLTNKNLSFSTQMRVQRKNRQDSSTIEDVQEIGVMIEQILLRYYRTNNNKLPNKIVILRDGVSEGQYSIVMSQEIKRVKAMLSSRCQNLKIQVPKITCIVVQKRNKIRLKRVQPEQTRKGPDYNIQPGTVVDTKIVHPTDHEFYCAPHKAIQGTSRPARYYVILDEIAFSQDEAQAMINALSYLSPRCTKSTSIPTPINLADLAAERGKHIVVSWNDDNRSKMKDEERITKLNEFLANLGDSNYKNTLFYV